ncbi:MAG: hypothetical protein IPN54_12820 [Bacteroidetes bacterium]|nr:hypothetical protein [Bacteroidota bacterium]
MSFLKIRWAQFLRELKSLGLFYALILISGIVATLWIFYQVQQKTEPRYGSMLFIVAFILSIHLNRKDHRFIRLVSIQPFFVYISEYGFIAFIFVILSFLKSNTFTMFLLIPAVALISLINVNFISNAKSGWIARMIPASNYEWKSGVRSTGWFIPFLLLCGVLLAPLPFASLVICWIILALSISFYEQGESREMILSFMQSPRNFIVNKAGIHAMTFLICILPVLVANFIFFPDKWWLGLSFMLFCVINIAAFVTSKYAVWQHGQTNKSQSVLNSIGMIGLFIPFLLPIPIVNFIRNYRKATHNLRTLLNDFN